MSSLVFIPLKIKLEISFHFSIINKVTQELTITLLDSILKLLQEEFGLVGKILSENLWGFWKLNWSWVLDACKVWSGTQDG